MVTNKVQAYIAMVEDILFALLVELSKITATHQIEAMNPDL